MENLAKIIDHNDLVRDMSNQAILNIDRSVLKKHEKMMRDMEKEANKEKEILAMKQELSEIKSLLTKLIQNNQINMNSEDNKVSR